MPRPDVDVAVIGAGVAGLAAARTLRRAEPSLSMVVLEARERIGGRIYTVRDDTVSVPIELGAEFLHGSAPETIAIAREAGVLLCDVEGKRWQSRNGRLTRLNEFWDKLDRVMRRLDAERTPDRSFLEFIEAQPGGRRLASERSLALEFVQGFHAADASRISERALAEGGSPGEDPNEKRMARVLDGYDAVPRWLATSVRDCIRLNQAVTHITWKRGTVRLTLQSPGGKRSSLTARAAIVTVPLGVLLATPGEQGAIAFDPPIENVLSHARGLTMGNVLRITMQFREAFWENDKISTVPEGESLAGMSFLHSRDPDLPVWWTAEPIRAGLFVGRAGGPRAARLLSLPPAELERRALAALARQLGRKPQTLRRLLVRSWSHNWTRDPFARGAYSYIVVGGHDAPRRLARPIQQTLFFAGEAADPEGRLGTVNGAIATGERAAAACRRSLSR
ncbi:MAG: NAD(P)/FAD-dependent oxidoreductase [Gemmatimonadota bacterium]